MHVCACDDVWEMERLGRVWSHWEASWMTDLLSPLRIQYSSEKLRDRLLQAQLSERRHAEKHTHTQIDWHCHCIQVEIRGIKQLEKLPEATQQRSWMERCENPLRHLFMTRQSWQKAEMYFIAASTPVYSDQSHQTQSTAENQPNRCSCKFEALNIK